MQLGPYSDLVHVGQGGMGAVFKARSPEGALVAIKLLSRVDAAARARFERERRLLASFSEADGFVPLLDAGEAEGNPYLVMPFLEGGTLRDRLRGPLGVAETLDLARALAAALGKAHERGVIHRDLKPENILFTAGGRPLVADLGLAKHFDRGASGASQSVSLSRDGAMRGTAGYMAPEQMEHAKTAAPPADVFALGAIIYECLAGRPAFPGETVLDVVTRAGEARVETLDAVTPPVPPWLASVVRRALAREPAERYQDGLELGRALEAGKRVAAARGRGGLVAAGVAAALGLGALAAVAGAHGATPPRAVVTTRAVVPPLPAPGPLAPPPPVTTLSADELALSSEKKRKSNDLDGALEDALRAVELDPQLARAWGTLGLARSYKGDLEGAIAALTRAIELAPELVSNWANRGEAKQLKGDHAGAIEDETRAIALDPRLAATWQVRGAAREARGDLQGAIEDETRAIELDPGDPDAWRVRGIALERTGEHDRAIADLTRTIELEPQSIGAWVNRGRARGSKGDHDGAIEDETRAIEIDPRHAQAWGNRGVERDKKGDHDGAMVDLTRAIELAPELSTLWKIRAVARMNHDDRAGAAADFRRFIELAPDDPEAESARKWLEQNGR